MLIPNIVAIELKNCKNFENQIFESYGTPSPNNITSLKNNEVFVFGSNLAGIHGKGAALTAVKKYGAMYGKGYGHYGNSFAIPTKDEFLRPLNIDKIHRYIHSFVQYASEHPELEFMVTRIGCGLAGFNDSQIASLFYTIPGSKNIHLPEEFINIGEWMKFWVTENK